MRTRTFVIRTGADLGNTIAEARAERNLTQAELAASARVDRTYLSRLENGQVVQQFGRALRLMRQLGLTITATLQVDDG
ncbi:MAG: helix-turn-helix transcriptional regulator [Ilumatobacteraceae bacterium]